MEELPPDDETRNDAAPWLALVAAILLVLLGVWVMFAFKHSSDTLDCIASGRHNCVPVDQ